MDGVLFSAEPFIEDTYRIALIKSGLQLRQPSTKEIITQFGNPVKTIFANLFGKLSDEDFKILQPLIIETITDAIRNGRGKIYDGVSEIIGTLSASYKLAVCSNAGAKYVTSILETHNLSRFFLPVLTLTETGNSDKSGLLRSYISNTDTKGQNWMLFGDRNSDLIAARENNCRFTGCLWGFGGKEELDGAELLIDSPEEITGVLSNLQYEKAK
jgi:phosphoglycolate phosphatase-like HAD superfamily hydrolase